MLVGCDNLRAVCQPLTLPFQVYSPRTLASTSVMSSAAVAPSMTVAPDLRPWKSMTTTRTFSTLASCRWATDSEFVEATYQGRYLSLPPKSLSDLC